MKQHLFEFIKSIIQRGILVLFFTGILEKWVLLKYISDIHWSILTLIVWKDIFSLTILGRISWEKIKLSANIGKEL